MKKSTAHLVLVLFDVLAVMAVYYVFSEWRSLHYLIDSRVERISYQNYFSLIVLFFFMPLMHILTFINWQKRFQKLGNGLVIGFFSALIAVAVYLNSQIEKDLVANDYTECLNLSRAMTFSEFKTYMKSELLCQDSAQN